MEATKSQQPWDVVDHFVITVTREITFTKITFATDIKLEEFWELVL